MATTIFADPRSAVHETREHVFGTPQPRPSDKYRRWQNVLQNVPILGAFVPRSKPEPFERLNPYDIANHPDPAVQERWNSLSQAQRAQMVLARPSEYYKADRGERRAMLGLAPVSTADAETEQLTRVDPGFEQSRLERMKAEAEAKFRKPVEGEVLTGKDVSPGVLVNSETGRKIQLGDLKRQSEKARADALIATGKWFYEDPIERREVGKPGEFELGTAAKTQLQKGMLDLGNARNAMIDIQESYSPDMLRLRQKASARLINFRDYMAGVPLVGKEATDEEKQLVADVRNVQQRTMNQFNALLKQLSGVAVNPSEAKRAEMTIAHANMSPPEFEAALNDSMLIADFGLAGYTIWQDRKGEGQPVQPWDIDRFEVVSTVTQSAVNEYKSMMSANPDADPEATFDSAVSVIEQKFNITPGGYEAMAAYAYGQQQDE